MEGLEHCTKASAFQTGSPSILTGHSIPISMHEETETKGLTGTQGDPAEYGRNKTKNSYPIDYTTLEANQVQSPEVFPLL